MSDTTFNIYKKRLNIINESEYEFLRDALSDMKEKNQTNIKDADHLMDYGHLYAVVACDGVSNVVGMAVCQVQPDPKTCYMMIAYVSPDYRSKGVFNLLLKAIREESKNPEYFSDVPLERINFGVMSTNETMLEVMKAVGASVYSVTYTVPVE